MRFAKYHGLGNDFLVVDLRQASAAQIGLIRNHAVALCDRHYGIGADGVLAVFASPTADARMQVINSDGSEPEMCGNGIRCVAKQLFDRGGVVKPTIAIDTGAGVLRCAIDADGSWARSITVSMGAPRFARGEIPMTGSAGERCIEQPLDIAGHPSRQVTCVSMGNPHAITFVESKPLARELATSIGPLVERHAWFPNRTNAEFAHMASRHEIDLDVWERGCGITLACGTGACATVAAAIVTGRADEATPIRVNLPGGSLEITVPRGLTDVLMKGPAVHVFDVELEPADLERISRAIPTR
ncbi:MAG: diaminopimelate epimerase [Kofleriaceae bacterium]